MNLTRINAFSRAHARRRLALHPKTLTRQYSAANTPLSPRIYTTDPTKFKFKTDDLNVPKRKMSKEERERISHPRNEEIPFSVVLVAGENGLSGPTSMRDILSDIASRKRTHFVELSKWPDPGWDKRPGTPQGPIVRIVSYAELSNNARKLKESEANSRSLNKLKEVQFTWSMGEKDVQRRLEKAKKELEDGVRLDILFGPNSNKAGVRFPELSEMEAMHKSIIEQLGDSAVERKPAEIKRPWIAVYLQPSPAAKSRRLVRLEERQQEEDRKERERAERERLRREKRGEKLSHR
ncbi:hypothetical protein DL96DRAFT_910237 [Flagelloscypha sp. PMI_526]|nr:hypothetical protein DL96DRAFT_910237 [Flagelloscypha sp. PMI_526]